MDREPEELQFLSLVGIYRTSAAVLLSSRRLFSQILLSLVLPLSFLFLAHVHISHLLFSQIDRNESELQRAVPDSTAESRLLSRLSAEWTAFLLFKAVYVLFLLVFSLLSTSAVVYTIASLFSAKEVDFRKIFTVVPKVWKRLMATFLWAFLLLFAYNAAALTLVVLIAVLTDQNTFGLVLVVLVLLAYLAGLVWISVIWHLASVVSVLEDARGVAAMQKSRALIRGKTLAAVAIFCKLNFAFAAIEFGFRQLVAKGGAGGAAARAGFGLLFLAALCAVVMFGLVVQTVVYFVCKSYHHESIDKSSLSDHLEVYLGEYVPLKGRDVQLEHYYTTGTGAAV
ncbi:uncharacterized protein M6B38_107445 [Iris pallida]|uniref:Uncharacterized protein n=1 Tax=Iris pallida TaxID=29817 RepID=A0AAX6EH43_IRIPA|nr:uncharacterized protein M6B38_107445 [Iris pallida]